MSNIIAKIRIDHVCGSYLGLRLIKVGVVEDGNYFLLDRNAVKWLTIETSEAFINKYLIYTKER